MSFFYFAISLSEKEKKLAWKSLWERLQMFFGFLRNKNYFCVYSDNFKDFSMKIKNFARLRKSMTINGHFFEHALRKGNSVTTFWVYRTCEWASGKSQLTSRNQHLNNWRITNTKYSLKTWKYLSWENFPRWIFHFLLLGDQMFGIKILEVKDCHGSLFSIAFPGFSCRGQALPCSFWWQQLSQPGHLTT